MSRNVFVYAAVVMGSLAIALDFASVDLALPALERQFALDLGGVQWVINGYVLAFSVLMVAAGRLADGYGRKRAFLLGLGIFALASALGGAAWSGGAVIGFRILQGVGAALLWPAMIGMACAAVGDARRGFALGLIFGSCSLGNAAGPLVGGALTEWFSWRWVLWINVPMALFAMLVTVVSVPRDPVTAAPPKNDYAGMAALTGGMVALMLVVYQGGAWGWSDGRTLGLGIVAAALLGAFPFIERRVVDPFIPADLRSSREFWTLCFCAVAICQLFFIVLLYFTQYAMKFLGDDPIAAGGRVVQFMLSYGLVSYFGGPLTACFGARRLLLGGLGFGFVASVLLGIFGAGAHWLPFNFSLVLLGISVGAVIPTVSARAIEAAGAGRASLASGITFMFQLSGSAFMLVLNTAVFAAVGTRTLERLCAAQNVTLTADQEQAVQAVIAGARNVHMLPTRTVTQIPDLAGLVGTAYQSGLQVVMGLGAMLLLVAFAATWWFVPARAAK